MPRFLFGARALVLLPVILLLGLLSVVGCGSPKIILNYPSEVLDFRQGDLKIPALYIDLVTDMRPIEQRAGQGHFLGITFPKDEAWERPATEVYGEALAQDLDETHLVELVPFQGQADFTLSVDLMSMACRLERSASSYIIAGTIGAGVGFVMGEDAAGRASRATLMSILAMAAIPMPTHNHAEAEVRMTLRDQAGQTVWQATCYGEYDGRKFMSPTARQDQEIVDKYLTRAVKRANACLLGQLRQAMLENLSE